MGDVRLELKHHPCGAVGRTGTTGTPVAGRHALQPWMRRRVPARAVECACTVLKVILPEAHSKKHCVTNQFVSHRMSHATLPRVSHVDALYRDGGVR